MSFSSRACRWAKVGALVVCFMAWNKPPISATAAVIADSQPSALQISPSQDNPAGRPMVPEDLLHLSSYGSIRVSPDGQMVAVEIIRRALGSTRDVGDNPTPNHRSELLILSMDGRFHTNLTEPRGTQVSQWNPVWSPDSKRLAFLSNEGRGNAFLEVWDRHTGRTRKLSALGVDLQAEITSGQVGDRSTRQMQWLDDRRLLTVLLPEGIRSPFFDFGSRSLLLAMSGARDAMEGTKTTAVVASSPPGREPEARMPKASLVIVDSSTGDASPVGHIPASLAQVAMRQIVVSPNGMWAAVAVALPPQRIDPSVPLSNLSINSARLGVASLRQAAREIRWIDSVIPLFLGFNIGLDWKVGGAEFAVIAQENDYSVYVAGIDAPTAAHHVVARLDGQRMGSDSIGNELAGLHWLPDNRVAVQLGGLRVSGEPRDASWWAVDGENAIPLGLELKLASGPINIQASIAKTIHKTEFGRLYVSDSGGRERTLIPELNPQLKVVAKPQFMGFAYTDLNGTKQYANLMLPYGFTSGKRYPTVVYVYRGDIHSENDQPESREDEFFFNSTILAGRGYAILFPSVPLPPQGTPGDPMLHLNDGVDPAVDQAVEMGITDPNRLVLTGHSYGGYSVFGLLTQTHRYRAAIATMGTMADLVTTATELSAFYRYSDPEFAALGGLFWMEATQAHIGVPPWKDPERYVRNSPIFFADRIVTPLLIICGDLDFAGTGSEQMFTALNRLGKRAELVRYLGEVHGLNSPANVLDAWSRITSWLDTYVESEAGSRRQTN